MTYTDIIRAKEEALSVQTNIHIALRLLREGKMGYQPRLRAFINSDGRLDAYNDSDLKRTVYARDWHSDLQTRFRFHPAIDKLLGDYRPADWQRLVLEYPHQAESDRNRIAYTQTETKGRANIQTVTSLGKYIRRHFPDLPDHEIRNTVASYSVAGCKIVYTTAEMLNALFAGPRSCMNNGWNPDSINDHPYKVYDPLLGWGMAIRTEGGEVVGRALVYDRDDTKIFVRTYLRPSNSDAYSQADDQLNAWLRDQGYTHSSDWEGCYLRYYKLDSQGMPLAPYLDGGVKNVRVGSLGGSEILIVDEDGEFRFESTDGRCRRNDGTACEDCGDYVDEDDGYWVGRSDDSYVCQHCLDHNYFYVYGRRGNQYHLHENQVVHVGDEAYDEDYLADNDIVYLEDRQEHAHIDDAVFIESIGDYYHCDSDDVCYDDYNNQYELRDNCVELEDGSMCHEDDAWQCEATGDYYSDADLDDSVEIDGKRYHKDNAPETEDETTTEGE